MTRKSGIWFSVAIGLTALAFLYSISSVLMPFVAGLIGAYILNGLVEQLTKLRISRGIASSLVIIAFIVTLITLIVVAIPYIQKQLLFVVKSLPSLVEGGFYLLSPMLEKASEEIGTPSVVELKGQLMSQLGNVVRWLLKLFRDLVTNSMAIANIISLVFLTPIVMYYLLKDWEKLTDRVYKLLPRPPAPKIKKSILKIHNSLADYAKGQGMVCLVLMVSYATSLGILGLHQGVFIGILTGFFSFVPYVGTLIGFVICMWVGATQYTEWLPIITIVGIFIAINTVENNFLVPRMVGERIGLHPVWVIFALLVSASWFGFIGMLFALPGATIVAVLAKEAIKWYKTSEYYMGKPKRVRRSKATASS